MSRWDDPHYGLAIDFIAWNDDPGAPDALELRVVRGYVTTVLIAHVFGLSTNTVAKDVVVLRREDAGLVDGVADAKRRHHRGEP